MFYLEKKCFKKNIVQQILRKVSTKTPRNSRVGVIIEED